MLEATIDGVTLQSRGGLRREIDEMTRVLATLPPPTRRRLVSIFCDSTACAVYSIEVKAGHWIDGLDCLLDDRFYSVLGGHNGLHLFERAPPCDAPMPRRRFGAMGTGFYTSPQWLELRYDTLRRHGARCQCCGASGPEAIVQVDHIKPRRDYPELSLDPANLQVLCRACNLGKGARDTTDWRPREVWREARWSADEIDALACSVAQAEGDGQGLASP